MINLDLLNVDVTITGMQEKEEQIKSLKALMDKRISEQVEIFFKYAKKLLPIFKFLQDRRYRFHNPNPDINYYSSRGPVLAFDTKERKLYVFGVKEERILEVELGSEKVSSYNPHIFFESFNFNDAMEGLKCALEIQTKVHQAYNEDLTAREKSLEEY